MKLVTDQKPTGESFKKLHHPGECLAKSKKKEEVGWGRNIRGPESERREGGKVEGTREGDGNTGQAKSG